MKIDEAIKFCNEKSKNIKLKAEPQVFIDIADWLEELKEKRKSFNEIRKAGYGHGYSDGYKKALYELAEDISEKAFENSFKITITDGNGVTYPVDVVTLDYVSEMVFDLAEQLEDAMTD